MATTPGTKKEGKSLRIAWLLFWTLGWFGAHHFYLGKYTRGTIYLFTLGGFLLFWVWDLFTLTSQVYRLNQYRYFRNHA